MSVKRMVKEIEELKIMLEIINRERDQSSNEEMCKAYIEV